MKLSEIDESNITNELIRDVLFNLEKSSYDSADVLIVFGCHIKALLDERLNHALAILKTKKVDNIIISGGVGEKGNFNESEYMMSFFRNNGITENIIIENESKNSLENVLNCLEILREKDVLDKKIVLVSSEFHIRKLLGMFKHAMPNLNLLYDYPESSFPFDVIVNNDTLRSIAVDQVVKLKYLAIDGTIPDDEIKTLSSSKQL